MNEIVGLVTIFVLICLVIALYFLPAIIALANKNPQVQAIYILNLLFGWTVIGWGIALVWAFIVPTQKRNHA